MKTKRILRWYYLSLMLAFVATCFVFAGQFTLYRALAQEKPQEQYIFRMTDGYFQLRNGTPIHLIHSSIPRSMGWLGDEYKLWIKTVLREDVKKHPCSKRTEEECTILLEFIGKTEDGNQKVWVHWKKTDRFDDKSFAINFSVPVGIPRTAAFGDAAIRFRLIKGEDTLFSYEIPLEIR